MKKIALIIFAVILFSADLLCANTFQDTALYFMEGALIPDEGKNFFLKNSGKNSWVSESEDNIYSFCSLKIPKIKDGNNFAKSSMERNFTKRAELQATVLIAERLDKGKLNRKLFADKDAAEYTLRTLYEEKIKGGFQSVSGVFDDYALSFVWIEKNKNLTEPLSDKELTETYCSYLYNRAQYFFRNKDFENALKTFHQIHYMAWANIDAYLDTSICFLKMDQKDDAIKLTSELVKVFSNDMKPDEMANAGKILFNAGEKDKGFNILELAYKNLKSQGGKK